VPGRCEFVVWIHDLRNAESWEAMLPLDPASGTNVAFGIGLNPESESGTFALELGGEEGVFEPSFEFDVRGVVFGDFVGLFVPGFAVSEFDAINVSTFCAEEGFSFSADASGADQLGLVELTPQELGEYTAVVTPTSTVTLLPPNTVAPDSPSTAVDVQDDDGASLWGLTLIGIAAVSVLLLTVTRRFRPRR
jgi:hypothetical protein